MNTTNGEAHILPLGRPSKYRSMIMTLEEHELYSAGAIARLAESGGWFADNIPLNADQAGLAAASALRRQRMRIALGRFSVLHHFPKEGDGLVYLAGQPATPGWFGWRWQDAVRERE